MSHQILPHGQLEQLTDDIWRVQGSLSLGLTRYMTVVKLDDGNSLIYSAIALDDEGMKALEALGQPSHLIVPTPYHIMDAPFYKARYPDIVIIAASDGEEALGDKVEVDGPPETLVPPLGVRYHISKGTQYQELVLDVPVAGGDGGRALFFCDLACAREPNPPIMARIFGPPGHFGVPRITKFKQVLDRPAMTAFLQEWADLPDIKFISGAHGPHVDHDCSSALRQAAEDLNAFPYFFF